MTAALVGFLPLAITQVDATFACVGGLGEAGEWLRPEPVYLRDVELPDSPYAYFRWCRVALGPPTTDAPRPEDRALYGPPTIAPEPSVDGGARINLLARTADRSVEEAFSGLRSLGLIEAEVMSVYAKRSLGGQDFIRIGFTDTTGVSYDWIAADLLFVRALRPHVRDGRLDPLVARRITSDLHRVRCFLSLGLTQPNHRVPSRFRGCQPIVVGVHTPPW